jgi:hypothetical protein
LVSTIFLISRFFLNSFRPSPNHPRHTCGPFASHQCAPAPRLKIAAIGLYYIALNGRISEFERILEEAISAKSRYHLSIFLEGVRDPSRNFSRCSLCRGWDSSLEPPEKGSTIVPLYKSAWALCILIWLKIRIKKNSLDLLICICDRLWRRNSWPLKVYCFLYLYCSNPLDRICYILFPSTSQTCPITRNVLWDFDSNRGHVSSYFTTAPDEKLHRRSLLGPGMWLLV